MLLFYFMFFYKKILI